MQPFQKNEIKTDNTFFKTFIFCVLGLKKWKLHKNIIEVGTYVNSCVFKIFAQASNVPVSVNILLQQCVYFHDFLEADVECRICFLVSLPYFWTRQAGKTTRTPGPIILLMLAHCTNW